MLRLDSPVPQMQCPFVGGVMQSIKSAGARDLSQVRCDIKSVMYNPNHDDGTYAPLLIRFAWHCCGTYDKEEGSGGSNGCTMRFTAEQGDPENAGLDKVRALLEPIHEKHPWLSFADLWILAGYVAIEELGGPRLRFSTGRKDYTWEEAVKKYGPYGCPFGDGRLNPCGSRLPAGDLGADSSVAVNAPACQREAKTIDAVRGTFKRMGFNDQETVALIILGHQCGRMHTEVSGFEGTWTHAPARWNTNSSPGFFTSFTNFARWRPSWAPGRNDGARQWENQFGFVMLPADMALMWDKDFFAHVQHYDKNRTAFRRDSVNAWKTLTTLGCSDLVQEANFQES
jgi:catalase (peroxidase I)